MADKQDKLNTANLVGHQLGDYLLTSRLATGGMAYIYKGIDQKLQREAAIKVLTPDMMETDTTLTERFQREARAIAALEHDNIVTIYQYGDQDGVYFLAMKFVPGMDLADELSRLRRTGEKMEIKRALRILEQVASALDYAHQHGIVHRDIKPSNILLDQHDKAVLTDFGLVLRQSVDQTMGTAFGTPRYISPEQAIASEDAVPQSDIYSLAVVVFEILTGRSVFQGSTPMEMALSHINEPPPPPRSINPQIPDAVEAEILKALSKDPAQRHQTATEFIRAIKRGYRLPTQSDESDPSRPLGFAPTSEIPPSKTPIIEFTEGKAIEAPIRGQVKKQKQLRKKRRRWPVTLASIWLVIVTVGLYVIVNRGSDQNTFIGGLLGVDVSDTPAALVVAATDTAEPTPTDTPVPPSDTPVVPSETPIQPTETTVPPSDTPIPSSDTPVPPTDTPVPPSDTPVSPTEAVVAPTDTVVPEVATTEVPVVVPTLSTSGGGNRAISLIYSYEALAMRNSSSFNLDVSGLKFVRDTDDGVDDFYGTSVSSSTLPTGKCVLIQIDGRRVEVPDDWHCGSTQQHNTFTRAGASLFWRVSGMTDTFTVWLNDQPIAVCPAVSRGKIGECEIDWTAIAHAADG